jgi:hypothetical protein
MNQHSPENAILQTIGRLIDIEDLAFDDEGLCLLELADEIPVALKNDTHRHRVVLIAVLATIEELAPDLSKAVLGWNLQRREQYCPWIAWDEEDSRLVMGEEISHRETAEEISKKFETFMDSLLECRGFLADVSDDSAPSGSAESGVDWTQRA